MTERKLKLLSEIIQEQDDEIAELKAQIIELKANSNAQMQKQIKVQTSPST